MQAQLPKCFLRILWQSKITKVHIVLRDNVCNIVEVREKYSGCMAHIIAHVKEGLTRPKKYICLI